MSKSRRPTADLIVIIFAGTICLVLVMLTVGMVLAGTLTPNDFRSDRYLQVLISLLSTVLGATLGLLAGRVGAEPRPSREDTLGDPHPPAPPDAPVRPPAGHTGPGR